MKPIKKIFIKTYGCQMNVYDSFRIQDLMNFSGYEVTNDLAQANVILFNTCHIREKAAEKVYSELGKIKKNTDKAIIVVAGCVGQAEGEEIFSRSPFVDIVIGPQSYYLLPKLVSRIENGEKHLIELDFVDEAKFDKLPEEFMYQGISTFVSVQEGCDKFCSFCVVPYTRGSEFSRPLEQVYREVLQAVSNGAKEIILLGQNVNSYHGKDVDGNECDLASLIHKIAKIKDLKRIRYTTSHPKDMTESLIKLYGEEEKLMPFLHLPVQSGSDNILKKMNRKYTSIQYLEIVNQLRQARKNIVLSSDFIVGFPGETDEDFESTLALVKKVKYSQCYSFKYSPRPGTQAASKPQIPEEIKSGRLKKLQSLLINQQLQFNESCVGNKMAVLFDRQGKYSNQLLGKTPYMQSVYINEIRPNFYGNIIEVKITGALKNSLICTSIN